MCQCLLEERDDTGDAQGNVDSCWSVMLGGTFLLTALLSPKLVAEAKKGNRCRVVDVSSGGMVSGLDGKGYLSVNGIVCLLYIFAHSAKQYTAALDPTDFFARKPHPFGFRGDRDYALAKRAQVVLSRRWAKNLREMVIGSAATASVLDTVASEADESCRVRVNSM